MNHPSEWTKIFDEQTQGVGCCSRHPPGIGKVFKSGEKALPKKLRKWPKIKLAKIFVKKPRKRGLTWCKKFCETRLPPQRLQRQNWNKFWKTKCPDAGKTTHISRRDDKTQPNFGEPTLQVYFFLPYDMNHVQSTALCEEDGICPVQSRHPAHFPRKQPNPTKEWDEVFSQGSGQILWFVQSLLLHWFQIRSHCHLW